MITEADKARIANNLAFIKSGIAPSYPRGWVQEVFDEARAAGLLSASQPVIGCNCKPGIDRGIEYGGDKVDAF